MHGHKREPELPWEGPFKGTINDKTMSRTDMFLEALQKDKVFYEFEFEVYINGRYETVRKVGAYAINDGGYNHLLHTIAGPKADQAPSMIEEFWGGTCESIRKDSERVFGVNKKRFRILRLPFLLHRARDIDTIMKVCVILHNMLLQYDGLDTIGDEDSDYIRRDDAEVEIDYTFGNLNLSSTDILAEAEDDDPRSQFTADEQRQRRPYATPVTPNTDLMLVGNQCPNPSAEEPQVEEGYEEKRKYLMMHHHHAWERKEVMWLKTADECRPVHSRDPYGAPGPWRRYAPSEGN